MHENLEIGLREVKHNRPDSPPCFALLYPTTLPA
jgi:hypothetical protein